MNTVFRLAGYAVLFVVLLEFVARAEDSLRYDAPFWGHYHLEGIRGIDERGTVRCKANARYKHFQLGEHGFRLTPRIEQAQRSLIWLGASEAFGLYETPGEDVANQLERRLAGTDATADLGMGVTNASCFGLNVPRMQRLIERPVAGMQPDLLALYPTPHFYLDMTEVTPDTPPQANKPAGADGFVSRVLTKSRDVIKSFLPMALQDRLRKMQAAQALGSTPEDELWRAPPADRLALYEQHMRDLLQAATATGARVAVLTHANAFHKQASLDESLLQSWQKFYPRATGRVLIDFDAQGKRCVAPAGAGVRRYAHRRCRERGGGSGRLCRLLALYRLRRGQGGRCAGAMGGGELATRAIVAPTELQLKLATIPAVADVCEHHLTRFACLS